MKHNFLPFIALSFLLFGLIACNAAGGSEPTAPNDVSDGGATVDACPEAQPGTKLWVDEALGVCFLYPDNYEVMKTDDGSLTLYVDSTQNTEAPLATVQALPMNGRTIQEVVPDYPSDAELAAMSFLTIDLGGEMATVIDILPGQDTNRRIFAVRDDKVYDLMIARIGEEYGAVGEAAEDLFSTLTSSFRYIDA